MAGKLENLEHLINQIDAVAAEADHITLGMIMEAIGNRSFGPLLTMVGIILFSPLSGIPGMPTTMGVMVLVIAVQLLAGQRNFWLPRWLLNRSVASKRLAQAVNGLTPAARHIDCWLKPRLSFFLRGIGLTILAIACIVIAAVMPVMEIVPFSATSAGAILAILGLSLMTRDGLMALIAYILTTLVFVLIVQQVF